MAGIFVVKSGLLDTVQDLGRFGQGAHGIPPSGALDEYSFRLGNHIVGNEPQAAGLEMTLQGPVLQFRSAAVFALTGATFSPRLNGESVPMLAPISAEPGDRLEMGVATAGLRGYLAVAGGIVTPLQLGSRSTYAQGGFGRPLQAGDEVPLSPTAQVQPGPSMAAWGLDLADAIVVRLIKGPEWQDFGKAAQDVLLNSAYRLRPESNRMGLRLTGPALLCPKGADILSSGVSLGTVQVPGDGQPIILMHDRQTTGGYRRIACCARVDLPRLAQMRPGGVVRFQLVDVETAQALWRRQLDWGNRRFRVQVADRKYTVEVERVEP